MLLGCMSWLAYIDNMFCLRHSVTAVCIDADAYHQEPGALERCLPFPGLKLGHLLPYGLEPFDGQLEPFGLVIVLLCYRCLLVLVDLPDLASCDGVHIDIQTGRPLHQQLRLCGWADSGC